MKNDWKKPELDLDQDKGGVVNVEIDEKKRK